MFAQLAVVAPDARGVSGYVQAGLGRFFGIQATVAYWASCWVGVAAVALAAAGYAGYLIPALAPSGPRLVTMLAVIWLAVAACWLGPRTVGRIEGLTLVAGLAPVLFVAVLGWLWFDPTVFAHSWNPTGADVLGATRASALTAFWAFLGLECAAAAAGVVRDPSRNVPRATLAGVAISAALYVGACAVLMGLMPAAELARSSAPFADATRATVGVGGAGLIAVCAFLRAGGCTTGWVLVTSETSREAADQGAFPAFFRTRPGERASAVNLIATGVLMSAVAFLTASPTLGSQFTVLANVTVVLSLITYLLAGCSLFRLRGGLGEPRQRAAASATAIVAIGCVAVLLASAGLKDLALASIAPLAAAILYFALRRPRFAAA
jgi:arginine:agmatine antiporter